MGKKKVENNEKKAKRKAIIKKVLLIALAVIVLAAVINICVIEYYASKIPHRFASAKEGAELMLAHTEYYEGYSQNDIEYRLQKTGATLDELREASSESVKSYNIFEKLYIDQCLAKIERTIEKNGYKLPETDEIVFIKADMAIESGNSGYTHGTEIYLNKTHVGTYTFLHGILGDYFESLIWHEMFHCLTRNNPDFRAQMYSLINFTVADEEFEMPASVKDLYFHNPDVERHDSYATFIIDGQEIDCFVVWIVPQTFAETQSSFSTCDAVALVPIDGTDTYYTMDQASNIYEVFGENNNYYIDPEEYMANEFKDAMLYGMDGRNGQSYPNPEIIQGIIDYLKK